MRKLVLILLLTMVSNGFAQQRKPANPKITQTKKVQAQNCEICGVVTYFHNKFIGNRPDIGATIRLIKEEDLDSAKFNFIAYSYYVSTRSTAAFYWEIYNQYGSSMADDACSIFDFSYVNWKNFEAICDTLGAVQMNLDLIITDTDKKYHYESVVDAMGTYKLNVPHGNYYAIITSNNRKGIFMPELVARFEIRKIKLNDSTYTLNINFEKE